MKINYSDKIEQWISQNKDEIISEWIELIKIPSIQGEPQPDAPFGKECAEALDKAACIFSKRGYSAKVFSNDGYALIEYGSGDNTIGIFSHSDVVPVGDDWLYTKSFEPIIKEGALIGRGAEDNKSGIITALCIMEFLREHNIHLKSRIQLFIGSNEETGMKDIEAFTKAHPMPTVSLVPDADFPCSTGEKGIMNFFAKCSAPFCDIVDFWGGMAFNVVLDKATVKLKNTPALKAELESKAAKDNNISIHCDEDFLFIEAKGVAKHACDPEGSVNAAYLLADLLSDTLSLCENDRKILSQARHILSCPFGTSLGLEYCDDLFGRLTFVNGMVSLEDGHLKLSFDTRFSSNLDAADLEKRAGDAFSALGWTMIKKSNSPGFSIDSDGPIAKAMEDIYESLTGIAKPSIKLGGGTYARFLKNAFSVGTFTETSGRKNPIFKMPPGHGGAHQCDEMIDLESFFAAVKVNIHYILAFDEIINS